MSLTEGSASSVISDDAIEPQRKSGETGNARLVSPSPRLCITAATSSPLSASWREALEDHLVRIAGCRGALLGCPDCPGEQRAAEQVPRDPGRRRRQLLHPIGDEMGLRAQAVLQMQHGGALRLCQLLPITVVVTALGDDAARQLRHGLA